MKIFTTFCCAALAICSAVYAQSPADHMTVHFNSPVLVGETMIPAGNCDITVMHGSSDSLILLVRPETGHAVTVLASHMAESDVDASGAATVVLSRHGNDLQLSRVVFGNETGYQLNNIE